MPDIELKLHKKQSVAFKSKATEILYGGAAGSAKSHLIRVVAIAFCIGIPGLQVYLFRRIREDLIKNHMEGPTGFHALLAPWLGSYCVIVEDEIRFNNGSRIYLCHCKDEKDRFKYQGAEIHLLLIDELTHFTEIIYRFLRSRVRIPLSMNIPEQYKGQFPRILCGSNPGGIGHQFVKTTWIDPKPALEIWQTPPEEGGFIRQYIPARLYENPSIDQEAYAANLSGLGNPELVKAMLEGDWDVVAGAALDINRDRHMLRPFTPPQHWVKFQVLDWGYVRPYSSGWYCVVEGVTKLASKGQWPEKWLPDGAIIRYRENYGWTGKPNEGCRKESPLVVKEILDSERMESIDYRVADTGIWAKNDGTSIYERMLNASRNEKGQALYNPRQSEKDRAASYAEVCTRLKGQRNEDDSFTPMFYITENCQQFWRTVPPLILDELNPEKGPDEKQENHCLAPETLIKTAIGDRRLDSIATGDSVLTTDGYKQAIQLGAMDGLQKIYTITLDNGHKIRCTSDHRFLTNSLLWVRCAELSNRDKLCAYSSLAKPYKNSMASGIGVAKKQNTLPEIQKAKSQPDCIEWYGNIIMAKYQRVFISIIWTMIEQTTRLKILSLSPYRTICDSMLMNGKIANVVKNIYAMPKSLQPRRLSHGMAQKRDCNGIQRGERLMQGCQKPKKIPAKSAWLNFLVGKNPYVAARNAGNKTSGIGILSIVEDLKKVEVWNLHVPGPHNYILANDIVSHNCWDEVCYGLMSRPYIMTEDQRLINKFHRLRAENNLDKQDPYRLRSKK